MDFLGKAWTQLGDLFRSMSPGARLTAGLLLAVVVVAFGYLLQHQVSGQDAWLLSGASFSPAEMTAMEAAFGKAGLSDYKVEGSRIQIPHGRQAVFMAALVDGNALPQDFGQSLSKALSSANPLDSRLTQEERIRLAKQQELALWIRSMPGIENAAILYDTKRTGGFRGEMQTTASVNVKAVGGRSLDERTFEKIRYLVSGAIAGLSAENVTVVDSNGLASPSPSQARASGHNNQYLEQMQRYQQSYADTIRQALQYVPGVTVSVNVELNKEVQHDEQDVKIDPKTVPIRVREENRTANTEGNTSGGRPGLDSQQRPNQPANLAAAGKGPKSEDEQSTSETENLTSQKVTTTQNASLTPEVVHVAVGIPTSYFVRIWQQRNPPAAGQKATEPDAAALTQIQTEETTKIRSHVATLLPRTAAAVDPTTLVTVSSFLSSPVEPIATISMLDRVLTWLNSSWSTLGVIGLVLVSLLMLRSMIRSAPAPQPASVMSATVSAGEGEGSAVSGTSAASDAPAPKRLKRKLGTGSSLKEELTEMVREDPDAAANILRSWIGSN